MNIIKWATNRKYRLFAKKIKNVQMTIWEFDFKVMKSQQIREGVRQDRERAVEALQQVEAQLKAAPTPELEAQKKGFLDNIARYEKQMQMIDRQVQGFNGSETEEPVVGILEEIGSLSELREMYKQYLTTI